MMAVVRVQFLEGVEQPRNVLRRARMDDIEIVCIDRRSVESGGNTPDDDKFDFMTGQRTQDIPESAEFHYVFAPRSRNRQIPAIHPVAPTVSVKASTG